MSSSSVSDFETSSSEKDRLVFSRLFDIRGNLGNTKGFSSFLPFSDWRNPTILVYKKDESDGFSSENELSNSLRERFSSILPYQLEPKKKENAEETLDNVWSVPINNASNQESNPHVAHVDRVIRNNLRLGLLLWLKSRRGRGVSPHPSFMGNNRTISHTF